MRGLNKQWCDKCNAETLHASFERSSRCSVCNPITDLEKHCQKLGALKTDAQRIEYLLRVLNAEYIAPNKKKEVRGANAKNITRILRKGRERIAKAKADPSMDLSVLPPSSKIRQRSEASWKRLLEQGFSNVPLEPTTSIDEHGRTVTRFEPVKPETVSRGSAGRKAAVKEKRQRSDPLTQRARELRAAGEKQASIARQLNLSERTVRRYLRIGHSKPKKMSR